MASFLIKGTIWMVAYTYAFISMVLYGLLTARLGLFFKKPTEKDQLELQLGMCHIPSHYFPPESLLIWYSS